jgi:branched-subunit amino acid aminotransferase/4-amino-4-deoxychorismate lyase
MPADLESADGVFITSTTRNLLPVAQIEEKPVGRAERTLLTLQEAFGEYVNRYLTEQSPSVYHRG